MGSDGAGGKDGKHAQRLPIAILAVIVASGLLLTSAAVTTSWSFMHGGDREQGPYHECSVHRTNYQQLHKQVTELAELFPELKGILVDSPATPPARHRLRRLLGFQARPTPTDPPQHPHPQPAAATIPAAEDVPKPEHHNHHHRSHGSLHGCMAQVADLHARVFYALRLVTREARGMQDKVQDASVRADRAETEVLKLTHEAALAKATPAPAALPSVAALTKHDESKVGLNTEVVVGVPVRFEGQVQHMVLPVNDQFVGGMIRENHEPFQKQILSAMLAFVRPNTTVLDVGGNVGTYAMWFARKVGPQGTVYSFEAQSFIHTVLSTNLLINGHRNVKALHTAVSFKAGVTHMGDKLVDGATGGKNFSEVTSGKLDQPVNYGGRRLGEGGEEVPMITIDSLNTTNVSFIKLDIQGSEPLAVYGARETIKANKPVVQYENEAYLFNITADMVRDMAIPEEVQKFSIQGFLRSLDYRIVLTIDFDEFWVPPGYQHAQFGWDQGALSAKHLKAGLRGGKEFAVVAPVKTGAAVWGQGVEGTALPLQVPDLGLPKPAG